MLIIEIPHDFYILIRFLISTCFNHLIHLLAHCFIAIIQSLNQFSVEFDPVILLNILILIEEF